MQPVVQIGALQFALGGAFTMTMRPIRGRPFAHLDGDLVQVVETAGRFYLVVDHRSEADGERPARVEVWTQTTRGETDIEALLAVTDASFTWAAEAVPAALLAAFQSSP